MRQKYWRSCASRAIAVFRRLFPYFATKDEAQTIGFRLAKKYSYNEHSTFKAMFPYHAFYGVLFDQRGCNVDVNMRLFVLDSGLSERAKIDLKCLIDRVSKTLKEADMRTTGELRKALAGLLLDARDGKITGDALRGVIGAANQINASMSVEMKMRRQLQSEGIAVASLGDMPIYNEGEKENG
jgi:hypothetical protein